MTEQWRGKGEFLDAPMLYIPSERLTNIEQRLGPYGPGVFHIPEALTPQAADELLAEAAALKWRDAGEDYYNIRGVHVIQNHEVYALKLLQGDAAFVDALPKMKQLALETEAFIQSLGTHFASLSTWVADEMSYHQYYDAEKGLTPHKDNKRFPGVVVVITIDGSSDFEIVSREPKSYKIDPVTGNEIVDEWTWFSTYRVPVSPGSMAIMRAPGLFAEAPGEDWRPEHAVMNVANAHRTAFLLRANSRPNEQSGGFVYENWPVE